MISLMDEDSTDTTSKSLLLYEDLTYKIRGCCFHVFNKVGPGHKESVYQKALAITFTKQRLNFQREFSLDVDFEGINIGKYIPDFVVEGKIIIELKAVPFLLPAHKKQTISYLKATNFKLGLLVNFSLNGLQINRLIN